MKKEPAQAKGESGKKGTLCADKANAYCLWRAKGQEESQRLAAGQRHDRRKRPALIAFGESEGKKKANALQPAKGMTDENIAFGEPEGKKKASGSQRAEGMTDEKKKEERPRCGCTGVP